MRVIAFDSQPSQEARDLGIEFVPLETLLAQSDFVSLHVALTPQTRGLFGEAQLRALIGEPAVLTCAKIADRLNAATRLYIERSPFVCLATSDATGACDLSPRGDPAGFVRILDDRTLLIPERPGNRIADTLSNLLVDDRVALLFLIPGVDDTFRVNGRAAVTDDADLLAPCAVEGRAPQLGIVVTIEEAYSQCPKALIRSDLWNPERQVERAALPSQGQILRSLRGDEIDADAYDADRARRYARREGLY